MSSVTFRTPVATARPPRGFGLRHLLPRLHRRRRAQQVFVAILHAADIPPS